MIVLQVEDRHPAQEAALNRRLQLLGLTLLGLLLVSCAPGSNPLVHIPDAHGVAAGFWRGLWHGAIFPVTLVISLFTDQVRVYEVHNAGGWYDFGFFLGLGASLGGTARSRCGAREPKA